MPQQKHFLLVLVSQFDLADTDLIRPLYISLITLVYGSLITTIWTGLSKSHF